ncbi:MAG: long-chain-fatty-acid--CoA ligase [Hyphomicrobiales bacterium]|nr:long-chain-fatty-acid--CoA ligase [Hyphomicrobiales bacterium]
MRGLMQDWPLTLDKVIDHAATRHGQREVVSRSVDGPIVRTTYAEIHRRAKRLSNALKGLGVKPGDRVATLAWNSGRHIEAWYAIMGIGAVCHTLNPRLFPDQLCYIINHAEDQVLFTDLTFLPTIIERRADMKSVRHVIVMTDEGHMASVGLDGALCFERLIEEHDDACAWGGFDENTAAGLCYTSGTTGNPKGVLYSHRSNVLHSFISSGLDCLPIGPDATILPVVPMFHANSWGLALSGPMRGAKMVMPGARLDGASVYELLETERVTFTAAVPTVWLMLLGYLHSEGKRLSTLKSVVIGGSACPPAMIQAFEDEYGVEVRHAWGMTEMSPLGSVGSIKPREAMTREDVFKRKVKQGWAPFGVEMKIVDERNRDCPWDGKTFGRLKVAGPAVVETYFKGAGGEVLDEHGFFDTGDVATIDPEGYMQIVDRTKDVIKSGGEWISTIDIENLAVAHPDVAEAAVIGVAHPKWDERPLLVVVPKEGREPKREDVLEYLKPKIAKWWMPDDMQVVKEIPHTATGKINKLKLRETFQSYKLPTV